MKYRTLGIVLSILALGAPAATAQNLLYGLSSSVPGTIYSIDTGTGAATALFNLTGNVDVSFTGLELLGGLFYATDVNNGTSFDFGSIDPNTTVFTPINNQGGSFNWHGLGANPNTNLLYSVDIDAAPNYPLMSVTTAGVISTIGDTGQNIRGMAYDVNTGTMYGVAFDNNDGSIDLFSINLGTGAATLIGGTGLADNFNIGAAFDSDSNTLYMNLGDGTGGNNLYSLNTTTGAATLIGFNGGALNIDGLAFGSIAQVPEPTTLALCGMALGAAGVAWRSRRRSANPATPFARDGE